MISIEPGKPTDIALVMLARAYHALAVLYEIKSPSDYNYIDRHILPYLIDTVKAESDADADAAVRYATALDHVRDVLAQVGTDVGAIRAQIAIES